MPSKSQVDNAVEMAIDKCSLEATDVNVAVTTTPTVFTEWKAEHSGNVSTADKDTGEFVAGRDGVGRIRVSGSFSASAGGTYEGNIYINDVSTNVGFLRDIANINDFGSFAGEYLSEPIAISTGDVIDLRLSVDSGTATVTFHEISMATEWLT